MSDNTPFESLIAAFDQILVSDNPAVQAALQNLLLLAALSQTGNNNIGPIAEMFETVRRLKHEVESLRTEVRVLSATTRAPGPSYPNYPYQPSWPGDTLQPGTKAWDDYLKWGATAQTTQSISSMATTKADAYTATSVMKRKKDIARLKSTLENLSEKMAKK